MQYSEEIDSNEYILENISEVDLEVIFTSVAFQHYHLFFQ